MPVGAATITPFPVVACTQALTVLIRKLLPVPPRLLTKSLSISASSFAPAHN